MNVSNIINIHEKSLSRAFKLQYTGYKYEVEYMLNNINVYIYIRQLMKY